MANSEIQQVGPSNFPAFVKRGSEALGAENLGQYAQPPLLKIVQTQSDRTLREKFGEGTTILRPQDSVVATLGQPFYVVPVFQYAEWITWAPMKMKGQVPAILDRSFSATSVIARKAANKDTREEVGYVFNGQKLPHPVKHLEHITFIMALYSHELGSVAAVLSYKSGEYVRGKKFASLLKARNCDIFACVFEATASLRTGNGNEWYGWDIVNPSPNEYGIGPYITDEKLYNECKRQYEDFKAAHAKGLLRVEHDVVDEGVTTPSTDNAPRDF